MNPSVPPGLPQPNTQAKELAYWSTHGLADWDLHLPVYERVFPFANIDYRATAILDVGSGPRSIFEKSAPADADVVPYDPLARDYNRIAPKKKFLVRDRLPNRRFDLVTILNTLDHMAEPAQLLATLPSYLNASGTVWIYCHVDRPFSEEEHPQKFRFWQLVNLSDRYFKVRRCGLIREGLLFPYGWWAVCAARERPAPPLSLRRLFWISYCGFTYGRFHAVRGGIKLTKLIGLRRLLPERLRF